jgi:hypothetical protein
MSEMETEAVFRVGANLGGLREPGDKPSTSTGVLVDGKYRRLVGDRALVLED